MSTKPQDPRVRELRRKLDLLREEADKATTEYQTWLGELVDAVDAQDRPSLSTSFNEAFGHGARLRDIIEEDVSSLLEVLARYDEEAESVAAVCKDVRFYVGRVYSLLWMINNSLAYREMVTKDNTAGSEAQRAFIAELTEDCMDIETLLDKAK